MKNPNLYIHAPASEIHIARRNANRVPARKAKRSEVPPEYRKSRAQKVKEIIDAIAMGICAITMLFAIVILSLYCVLFYVY